jgi:hypothetical protein
LAIPGRRCEGSHKLRRTLDVMVPHLGRCVKSRSILFGTWLSDGFWASYHLGDSRAAVRVTHKLRRTLDVMVTHLGRCVKRQVHLVGHGELEKAVLSILPPSIPGAAVRGVTLATSKNL